MIDIDAFKTVNDTFGHVVGNKVLTQIAKTLEHTVRNTDFVFRCGGDEFGVVLPGTDIEGAMHVAEKILQKVEARRTSLTSLGYSGRLTVSIGVSEYQRGSHFETLVAEADQALYASKRSIKNCAKASTAAFIQPRSERIHSASSLPLVLRTGSSVTQANALISTRPSECLAPDAVCVMITSGTAPPILARPRWMTDSMLMLYLARTCPISETALQADRGP